MHVSAKALKPNVTTVCKDGNVTLTCNTQKNDQKDLSITWIKGTEHIKDENTANLSLTSQQIQENKEYSCRVKNPVSEARSEAITVSCKLLSFHIVLIF